MQYDNYLHIAKCTNFIAPDQLDRLLDDCACWFSLHELSLTGRFSKPRRFSKIRSSYPPRVELGQRHWARQSKAARAQCGQRCPLCGTTAPPSFSGNGAIGSSCAAYCLLVYTTHQCPVSCKFYRAGFTNFVFTRHALSCFALYFNYILESYFFQ